MNTRERGAKNRQQIIDFLLMHTYTTIDVLCGVLKVKSKPMISRHLSRLVDEKLIKRERFKTLGGSIIMFGTTQKLIELYDSERTPFRPSKISHRTLEHTLYCQKLSAHYQHGKIFKQYKMEIVNAETGSLKKFGLAHRPDLILKPAAHAYICIECELSLKSKPRYEKIINDYCQLIDAKKILQCEYFFSDTRLADRFKRILENHFKKHTRYKSHAEKIKVRIFK